MEIMKLRNVPGEESVGNPRNRRGNPGERKVWMCVNEKSVAVSVWMIL